MLEKRYQVFVSSTFRDLVDERQGVLKAILELDHMPAGMELFPAVDDSAWQLIKDVIDSSDYYVLLIGGRYGSLDEEGLGYTEKEYDYAVKSNKPVIALLHKSPDNLPRDKTETSPEAWENLVEFRKKVERKHTCVYWESAEDLKSKAIVALTANVKRRPAVGWVRADAVPSDATIRDVLSLRKQVSDLEAELARAQNQSPPGAEELQQSDDTLELRYSFEARDPDDFSSAREYAATIRPTWNEIFSGVSPVLINEASDHQLRSAFRKYFAGLASQDLHLEPDMRGKQIRRIAFNEADIDTCLIQFRALGLIRESERKRSVTNTTTYWTLTPHGDRLMVQLRAVRREPPAKRTPGNKPEAVSQADARLDSLDSANT